MDLLELVDDWKVVLFADAAVGAAWGLDAHGVTYAQKYFCLWTTRHHSGTLPMSASGNANSQLLIYPAIDK